MKNKTRIIVLATTVPALALLYFFGDARTGKFFPRCIFHSLTNLYCPGCGSQRAISSLLHAEVLEAIHYNVLLVLSLPFVLYSGIVLLLNTFRQKQLKQQVFYSRTFVRVYLAIVIAFFILRNIPFYPFDILAPHKT